MFFSKNRDFRIFDIQIDAETAFFTQFFWNLICNPLKCPCRRGRGCGVLEVSLQPKHGADVPIIGIWGFFLFLYFPPFFIKKKTKHAPICRKNSGSNLFHSVTIFRKDWILGLAEYLDSNAQKWLLGNFVQHFSPFSKFFCSVSHIYQQGKSKNACHGYI